MTILVGTVPSIYMLSWPQSHASHGNLHSLLGASLRGTPINLLHMLRGGTSGSDELSQEDDGEDPEETRRMNAYLDDYVNELIATVQLTSPEQTESEPCQSNSLNETLHSDPISDDLLHTTDSANHNHNHNNEVMEEDTGDVNETDSHKPTNPSAETSEVNEIDDDENTREESNNQSIERSQGLALSPQSNIVNQLPDTTIEVASNSTIPTLRKQQSHKVVYPTPPNLIYRLLLPLGLIGRLIVMFCIAIAEILHKYIPELYDFFKWIFTTIGVYDPFATTSRRSSFHKSQFQRRSDKVQVNTQYSAFISSDATGGKKATLEQKRAVDAVAVQKLSLLGTTRGAKYTHLSEAFMKKYNLGKYAFEQKAYESIIMPSIHEIERDSQFKASTIPVDERSLDESDNEADDWVVKALSSNDIKRPSAHRLDRSNEQTGGIDTPHETGQRRKRRRKKKVGLPFTISNAEPSATIGNRGSAIGLSFSIGFNGKKSKSKMLEAAAASKTDYRNKSKKRVQPTASDREGGGGVLGRIRAVGANNAISSRLLGAYSLDAPPREEAGDARGVIELARRYGYGDWSDDDSDDSSEDNIFRNASPVKRSKQRPYIKRRNQVRQRERILKSSSPLPQVTGEFPKKKSGPFLPMSRTRDIDWKEENEISLL